MLITYTLQLFSFHNIQQYYSVADLINKHILITTEILATV